MQEKQLVGIKERNHARASSLVRTSPEFKQQDYDATFQTVADVDALLFDHYDQIRHNATAIQLIRTLSDNPPTENSRRTGRTARLLLRAMIALSAGKDVAVVGLNQQQALSMKVDVERHARGWHIPYDGGPWEERSEPGERLPMVKACTPETDAAGFRGVTLVDHSVIERMEAVALAGPVAAEVL